MKLCRLHHRLHHRLYRRRRQRSVPARAWFTTVALIGATGTGWAQSLPTPTATNTGSEAASNAAPPDPAVDRVEVQAPALPRTLLPKQGEGSAASTDRVDGAALDSYGTAGRSNPYLMASGLPGVKAQALDPWGMTSRIGGNKGMRVRGIAAWHGANGTVEGLPLSNVNPGPGYLQMFDSENLAGVSLTQGPVPPDRPALFTSAGALDSEIAWPDAGAHGAQLSTTTGAFGLTRLFGRADSGPLATPGGGQTRLALAGSDTHADLWRGPGDSTRRNVLAALASRWTDLELRLLLAASHLAQHNPKPLTAAQALGSADWRSTGYDLTPTAGAFQNAYGYNQQAFTDRAAVAELRYTASPSTQLGLKAYTFREWGQSLDAAGTNKTRLWLIDHDSRGLSADVDTRLAGARLKLGYDLSSLQPPGPPTAQKFYTASASGLGWTPATTSSSNQGWGTLSEVTARHRFQQLRALASQRVGAWTLEGGVRWWQERMPSLAEYNKVGVGNLSYADALAASSGVTVAVQGQTATAWLPYAGASVELSPGLQGRVAAGRNVGPASFDIWNSNLKSMSPSQQAQAQALWNTLKPETDDAIDLGLHWGDSKDKGWLELTVYHARIRNKSVNVYDAAAGTTYGQNIGQGHLSGVQLAWSARPWRALELYGNAGLSRAVFDQDLQTASSTTLAVRGLQFPDTPRTSALAGLRWQAEGWTVAPQWRWQGARYDDSLHTNRVAGYGVLDLNLGGQWKVESAQLTLELGIQNLSDRRYVGLIDVSELQSGTSSFYPGAPRSWAVRAGLSF